MAASLTTVSGGTVDFSDEQLVELGRQFRGPIFSPADPGFDEHRAVENLAIDRRPGLIIRCSGEADVIDASSSRATRGSSSPSGAVATTWPFTRRSMVASCSTCAT